MNNQLTPEFKVSPPFRIRIRKDIMWQVEVFGADWSPVLKYFHDERWTVAATCLTKLGARWSAWQLRSRFEAFGNLDTSEAV